MSSDLSRFWAAIDARIRALAPAQDQNELGYIQGDYALKVDRFPMPFPQGQYLISYRLTKSYFDNTDLLELGHHHHEAQTWGEGNPVSLLRPGDRVLVNWVNGGVDPIVMDVVVATVGT